MSWEFENRHLVLVGGGHTHLQILRDWPEWKPIGATVTLVSEATHAVYSGMLPGHLAGWYSRDEIQINLESLCARVGANFVLGRANMVGAQERLLKLESGTTCSFDVISFDIGATSEPFHADPNATWKLKPVRGLADSWADLMARLKHWTLDRPAQIATVGGGAAGFEITSVLACLTRDLRPQPQFTLWQAGALLSDHSPLARYFAKRALKRLDVRLRTDVRVNEFSHGAMKIESIGSREGGGRGHARTAVEHCDFVLLASSASGPRLFANSGLTVDERGFLKVDQSLQAISSPVIFGAGDCISFPRALPKNGVHAVREAATLRSNLCHALEGSAKRSRYRPQRWTLALMITGEKNAIASWGPIAWQGAGVWRWKDGIDRQFINGFRAK